MEKFNLVLIEGPRLSYCTFSLNAVEKKSKKEGIPVECLNTIQIKVDNKKHEVIAGLSVKSATEGIPFSFDIKSEAKFRCKGNCQSEEQALIEAIPYVFPFLKELVADLTRKAYLRPFYLPPLEMDIKTFTKQEKNPSAIEQS